MWWDASTDLQSGASHHGRAQSGDNGVKRRRAAADEKLNPIVTVLITLGALPGLSRDDGRNKIMTADKTSDAAVTTETACGLDSLVDEGKEIAKGKIL